MGSSMGTMRYEGYFGKIEYSDDDQCFIGRIAGIKDIITLHFTGKVLVN